MPLMEKVPHLSQVGMFSVLYLQMKRGGLHVESTDSKNKRGRKAGEKKVKAAKSKGVAIINHGAGVMPVDAPAPFGGARYSLLVDSDNAPPTRWICAHDGCRNQEETAKLDFADCIEFTPLLTPAQCIRAGIFGGCYFNPRGGKEGIFGRDVCSFHYYLT